MDDRTGRCISCGFLGARTLYPGLLEVQSWHRAQPALEFHVSARTPSVTVAAELMCYRRVTSLREEVEQIETAKELSRGEATELVLNRERHCEKWCEYEPAFDPKEHLVESKARQLDQDRKLLQLRIVELEDRIRQNSDRVIGRLTKTAIIIAAILGIAQLVVGIVQFRTPTPVSGVTVPHPPPPASPVND